MSNAPQISSLNKSGWESICVICMIITKILLLLTTKTWKAHKSYILQLQAIVSLQIEANVVAP